MLKRLNSMLAVNKEACAQDEASPCGVEQLKILIFSHEFPPFKGGAGVYSRDLALGFAALGVDTHVLTVRVAQDDWWVDGVCMHFLDDASTVAAQRSLCRLQLTYRFDVVFVTERRAQEDVARMPKGLFPYVAILHGTEILNYFSITATRLPVPPHRMAGFYERAELCVAVSKATAELARRLLPSALQCVVVPNGIDPKRLPIASAETVQSLRQCRPAEAKIVFCLGRLDLDKGHDVLIRAFASARRKCPQAYLLIGGIGPYRDGLEDLCEELELQEYVEFIGDISTAMLPAYFALCDVFALTSKCERRWEGFGLVYLEAGYYEKPVIGGNEGGVPEAIDHMESGLIVDPRSSESVAGSIVTLLTDSSLARMMGERGRQRVIDYFNAERMARDTLGYLGLVLHTPKAGSALSTFKLRLWSVLCVSRLFLADLSRAPRQLWSKIR